MQKTNNLQDIFLTKARKENVPVTTVPGERLSAAGRHHGVRLLRGGAGQRGAGSR